jgi:hypothetical protein
MKLLHLTTATAAAALLSGAAFAQTPNNAPVTQAGAPQPGSVTGDYNGAHAPSDDKQYTDTVKVPLGTAPATSDAAMPPASADAGAAVNPPPSGDVAATAAPSATQYAQQTATFTNMTVTNGPIPDTPENRAKYGGPDSRAGKRTNPAGN